MGRQYVFHKLIHITITENSITVHQQKMLQGSASLEHQDGILANSRQANSQVSVTLFDNFPASQALDISRAWPRTIGSYQRWRRLK